ncbi:bifunctional non-homologous end joining protein LigD [Bradyrhizobium sp. USDA 4341]
MQAEAIATIARDASGYLPQLPGVADEELLERLINDDAWVAEPKHDGERRMLIVEAGTVIGGNRKGQTVAVTKAIAEPAATFEHDVVLDGEQVANRFVYFDILSLDGRDLRQKPLEERGSLMRSGNFDRGRNIVMVERAIGAAAKRELVDRVRAGRGEGIVFKRLDATYDPGKPGSDATWFKFKFWQSCSCIIEKVNVKRSVALVLLEEDGTRLSVGNVTIPVSEEVPGVDDVVEVSYLYAFDGGSLFQPIYLGKRSDIDPAECLTSQRVFKKPEEPEDEMSAGFRM